MEAKTFSIKCSECGKKLSKLFYCMGTPSNEFDSFEINGTSFYCEDCDSLNFVEIEVYTE